jgi:hypothetical protein
MSRFSCLGLVGLALAVAGSGCNSNSPPKGPSLAKAYHVSGTISFPDGSKLIGGAITFTPVEVETGSKLRYEGAGMVDEQGHYKIGLNGDDSGLAAGEYKVTIGPRDYRELAKSNSARIPAPYRKKDSTPLTLTVKDQDNTFDIVLK